MPDILELFLILVVYYKIMYDSRKIMGFKESLTGALYMKLCHECDTLHYSIAGYSTSAKILQSFAHPHAWKQNID